MWCHINSQPVQLELCPQDITAKEITQRFYSDPENFANLVLCEVCDRESLHSVEDVMPSQFFCNGATYNLKCDPLLFYQDKGRFHEGYSVVCNSKVTKQKFSLRCLISAFFMYHEKMSEAASRALSREPHVLGNKLAEYCERLLALCTNVYSLCSSLKDRETVIIQLKTLIADECEAIVDAFRSAYCALQSLPKKPAQSQPQLF